MFWFVFIFALLSYGICQLAYVYRKRALETGESKIGLFSPSICSVCRKCKYFIFCSFIITVFTALIVSYTGGNLEEWSFFLLDHNSWELIHVIIAVLFICSVALYFYVHQEVLTTGLKKLIHIIL